MRLRTIIFWCFHYRKYSAGQRLYLPHVKYKQAEVVRGIVVNTERTRKISNTSMNLVEGDLNSMIDGHDCRKWLWLGNCIT